MKNQTAACLLLMAVLCLGAYNPAKATNYYFSSSGDDSRSAQEARNPATPWRSLAKLNAIFSSLDPGDSILFRCGDVFEGSIDVRRSGKSGAPIVFASYGTGDRPVISGLRTLSGWSSSGNTFTTNLWPQRPSVNVVLVNGAAQRIGRLPNANGPNGGYLTVKSYSGNNSITDSEMPSSSSWSGGEVVIRKNRWVLDRNLITHHGGNTLYYSSESGYWASNGYGYFIQNHPGTLDQTGEWYYDRTAGRLGVYLPGGAGNYRVEASVVDNLVSMANEKYISFHNLSFKGANQHAFDISKSDHISISNCSIYFSGQNAVNANSCDDLSFRNLDVSHTNNIAFNLNDCDYTSVKNSQVKNTGSFAGMGKGDSGSYEGLLVSGNHNQIEENTIENTGYIPITFSGSNVRIARNLIRDFGFVKDDGGGIYTWNNSNNPPHVQNRVISENIVLNGSGAPGGTDNATAFYAHGIYLDDNTSNVEVINNTVANCQGHGLYIHNAKENTIRGNTFYNNEGQLVMTHDDIAPNSPIYSTTLDGNILFSLRPGQPVSEYKSRRDDLQNFGPFDNNYYARPLDDIAVINTLKKVNGNYVFKQVDLDGWKNMSARDGSSRKSPKTISPFVISQQNGNNQFGNEAFSANAGGLYAFSQANNCVTSWNGNGLDGGSLQVSFSSITNSSKGTVVIGVGAVTAGRRYLLRFSMKGSDENKLLDVYLRRSGAPYNDLSQRKYFKITSGRTENEYVFTAAESVPDASIGIDIQEQSAPLLFDNIKLIEVNAAPVNPEDSIRFVYNAQPSAATVALNGSYTDVKNASYNGSITLAPYSSAVLIANTGNAAAPPPPPTAGRPSTCAGTGSILHEQWNDIGGNNISDLPLNLPPSSSTTISMFEGPRDGGDRYGSRIRGYICPPFSGNYVFRISGDDATELWLSSDDQPSNKTRIASSLSWTDFREWNKHASQKSAPIYLEAGRKYYIEALHKEGGGGDHLSVSWELPDGTVEAPIPGERLSPAQAATNNPIGQTIQFTGVSTLTVGQTVTLNATASSGLPVTLSLVSGPATLTGNVLTTTGPGTVVVRAVQAGNGQYQAAAETNIEITVTAAGNCSATGSILREQWNNVNGNDVNDIPLTSAPSSSQQLTVFESQQDAGDRYGARIRGYICPPQTGAYTFWIAGDDGTELWLSSDDNPANKIKIAYSRNWTAFRQWDRFFTQKSAPVTLEAGRRYYIEALQKEGNGGDHLSVAWELPGGQKEAPIPGSRLSPYAAGQAQTISFAALPPVSLEQGNITLSAQASSGLPVSFTVESGPATVSGNVLTPIGTGMVTIKASQSGNTVYGAAPDVRQTVVVLAPSSCSATGSIALEQWQGVNGNDVQQIPLGTDATSVRQITSFETAENAGDQYGSRIRGYICPPQTGNYKFWIAGDDATELWLSRDDQPSNKTRIAYSLSWTEFREWNRYNSQRSVVIYLEAGHKYYIEALHKEGAGGDHLSVAWELPDGTREAPIPGSRLAPYQMNVMTRNAAVPEATTASQARVSAPGTVTQTTVEAETGKTAMAGASFRVYPNPTAGATTIELRAAVTGMSSISLVDAMGKQVKVVYQGQLEKGVLRQIRLDVQGLAAGVYYLRVVNGGQAATHKLMIAK
ncbi:MAG TPA: PA14 domain-containing protein [Flavisolibacter sp.]|nr:PA14 domain-containing protein [Flavisolibacter sp.]